MPSALSVARLLIGGTASGVGKTTLTAGLIAALRQHGLRVQPFKAGPDYIDPSYHTAAAGVPSRNLDSWMLPHTHLRDLFGRAAARADVAIVEGVMGIFDGYDATGEAGSSAEIAKLLGAPAVLVVDGSKMARSAGAMVLGYRQFDPALDLRGVIFNRVGSPRHFNLLAEATRRTTDVQVLGYLPRDEGLQIPERHLGLIPTAERGRLDGLIDALARRVAETVDLDSVLALARSAPPLASDESPLFPAEPQPARTAIALASDQAFSFYYDDSLDLLRAWGAEIVPFSPLRDRALPAGVGGVYIGGGFPEVYAEGLAANEAMLGELRHAHASGLPIYAECGGLMYLSQGITTFEGQRYPMAGLVPAWSVMQGRRVSLGYASARALRSTLVAKEGDLLRGHEFHWSKLDHDLPADHAPYRVENRGDRLEGFTQGRLLASYVHLHFGSDARLAPRLVAACGGD